MVFHFIDNLYVHRNSFFDRLVETRKSRRKTGNIAKFKEPAHGAQPVREHHKYDESKTPAYVRAGISDVKMKDFLSQL